MVSSEIMTTYSPVRDKEGCHQAHVAAIAQALSSLPATIFSGPYTRTLGQTAILRLGVWSAG